MAGHVRGSLTGRPADPSHHWRNSGGLLINSVFELSVGELILSESACKLIRHHGVEPEAIPDEAVCRVRGKYWFHSDPE